ncbi:IS21 family transposase [Acidithiobacillus caldus]|uniref:IS21 family transposase n=1 Tax=Acidithiobacillus caldus TaxID=33059 RepID=UPI001C07ED66|nr:IS21 family transposase [Acidithiobacillus caldus]MBU2761849.1 IS21 family transposase [Acidithiobacillus caldus]
MKAIQEVLRLHATGLSHRQIAQACRLSKGAVGKYLHLAEQAKVTWPLPAGLDAQGLEALLFPVRQRATTTSSYAAPDFPLIHTEMRRKGMTLQLLWEEYVAGHAGQRVYRYSHFCAHYRSWKDGLKRSMRQTHIAGEKLFIDYAGPTVPIINRHTGEIATAQIFVAVLGASNYTYAEATWSQNLSDFLGSHVRALRYFGGAPVLLVPDNLKAAVTKACRYEPQINRSYQDLATHYSAVVLPTRPYKPRDKAKAELSVQVVERWVLARLRHFQFFALAELNTEIRRLLEDLNQRPFKRIPGCRRTAFESLDQPALQALPAQDYEFSVWKKARVNIDYHVEYLGHYYSVPYRLTRAQVDLRITAQTVEIFHDLQRVASHIRDDSPHRHSTVSEHMPKAHQRHGEWSPGRLLKWGLSIGTAARDVVQWQLTNRPHPEQGYRSCLGLLSLSRRYGAERLEAACRRALLIGAPTTRSVKSILVQGLDQVGAETPEVAPLPQHDNIRGPNYYH